MCHPPSHGKRKEVPGNAALDFITYNTKAGGLGLKVLIDMIRLIRADIHSIHLESEVIVV